MAHPLQGKWQIAANSPFGVLNMVATMNVNEDGTTFQGSVYDSATQKDYNLEDGKIEGNAISYTIVMKFGLIPMKFFLNGTFNDQDWTCQGVAKAMKMECSYTGKKILD